MASLIQGYQYDVFISYRHKDNAYDSWVATFVECLKKELAATFKEDVSIYFDQNASDGLHVHHHVNDSLKEKVKCLVFIPILSNTYCDPKSFAWQYEFKAFCDFVRQDSIGQKVNVGNGNVSSRILPIRIHELEVADITLYEQTCGLPLRAIDFIFKSSGINRPLRVIDETTASNRDHVSYRDQINRVAVAVKEIIRAIDQQAPKSAEQYLKPRSRSVTNRLLYAGAIAVIMAILAMVVIRFTSGTDGPIINTNSIAVLPFANLSNDSEQEFFSDGITEQITTELAQINNLKVIARTSVMQFKRTKQSIGEIGAMLMSRIYSKEVFGARGKRSESPHS